MFCSSLSLFKAIWSFIVNLLWRSNKILFPEGLSLPNKNKYDNDKKSFTQKRGIDLCLCSFSSPLRIKTRISFKSGTFFSLCEYTALLLFIFKCTITKGKRINLKNKNRFQVCLVSIIHLTIIISRIINLDNKFYMLYNFYFQACV